MTPTVRVARGREPVRVLHVVLDMDLGGLQRVVSNLVRYLDRAAFQPYVCCLDRGGMFLGDLEQYGCEHVVLGRRPGLFDLRLFLRLLRLVRKNRIAIVHSHNGCTLYGALAGRLGGARGIVHTDHGRLLPDRRGAILEDRYCSLMIDAFVGVSEALSAYLVSEVGVSRRKVRTVVNGVDGERFRPLSPERRRRGRRALGLTEEGHVLGTLCRLDPVKNLELLIGCFGEVHRQFPDAALVIAGDGPCEMELRGLTRSLGLAGAVKFLGRRDDPEEILPLLDLYLSTSHSEGTSMTILEAMASGVPVVATAVGGNVRLVDPAAGLLVPPCDKPSLVREVTRLLLAPSCRSSLAEGARLVALERHGAALQVRAYEELYREFCAPRASP